MTILVIGGSPKGEESVTMQYVRYLERKFPRFHFRCVYPARNILGLEQNEEKWKDLMEACSQADAVLWAFPLYVFLVHAGLKRFIELLNERMGSSVLQNKYCSALSTSIHFFDHTAHDYIRDISEDLGMRFVSSHSPKMEDLFQKDGQTQLERFFQDFISAVHEGNVPPSVSFPLVYNPAPITAAPAPARRKTTKKIVILSDLSREKAGNELDERDKQLFGMIRRITSSIDGDVETLTLEEMELRGNCMGCLKCGDKNICAYEGKDRFTAVYRETLAKADIILFCGAIRDRYLSSQWKRFFDRSFFNTHQSSLGGKHFGFIVAGPLSGAHTLRSVLRGYTQWQGSQLCGMVSDEANGVTEPAERLDALAIRVIAQAEAGYIAPRTFPGVGGMKIFRDDIYSHLKMVFRADHRSYRRTGVYDYVQANPFKHTWMKLLNLIIGIPFVKKQMYAHIREGMIAPYRRVIRKAS
ncbi:MAG: NAD(P)H-dependent oxidoreductase, partial [Spirochaetales bacterium]|nr:NAD(P)H-dependent oxidoreductase [Spirochaetales bacterium]